MNRYVIIQAIFLAFSCNAYADSCESVVSGAQMGPSPHYREWPWSNACYVEWPGGGGQTRSRYEQECNRIEGFIEFSGDYGSNRNTCIFSSREKSKKNIRTESFVTTPSVPPSLPKSSQYFLDLNRTFDLAKQAANNETIDNSRNILGSEINKLGYIPENDPRYANYTKLTMLDYCLSQIENDIRMIKKGQLNGDLGAEISCWNYTTENFYLKSVETIARLKAANLGSKADSRSFSKNSSLENKKPGAQSGSPASCFLIDANQTSPIRWSYKIRNKCGFTVSAIINVCNREADMVGAPIVCSDDKESSYVKENDTWLMYSLGKPKIVKSCNEKTSECHYPSEAAR